MIPRLNPPPPQAINGLKRQAKETFDMHRIGTSFFFTVSISAFVGYVIFIAW
jgi:hypothetical protein